MFERGGNASATPGLGLAICRAIVEAHDRKITGQMRPGGGACFANTLPRGKPTELEIVEGDDQAAAQP